MSTIIGEFTVTSTEPFGEAPEITTALGNGQLRMVKEFTGSIAGRSITTFVYAFNHDTGTGSYVAMEAFEGSIDGRSGTLNFWHSADTEGGSDPREPAGRIVPHSGTGDLADLSGEVRITIDPDGTHHLVISTG